MAKYATYSVEPTESKCVNEIWHYEHPNGKDYIEITENYRGGEFEITPTSDYELELLLNWDEDEFRPYDFEDVTGFSIFDQCDVDIESNLDEDEVEALLEEVGSHDGLCNDLGWAP